MKGKMRGEERGLKMMEQAEGRKADTGDKRNAEQIKEKQAKRREGRRGGAERKAHSGEERKANDECEGGREKVCNY